MSNNNIKATLLRLCDMTWQSLTELKQRLKLTRFNYTDLDTFAAPSTRIAHAVNERGETVCYTVAEKVFLISGYASSLTATPEDYQRGGDTIDGVLQDAAQLEGVGKYFMLVPNDCPLGDDPDSHEIKNVRVFVRRIPQTQPMQGLGYPKAVTAAKYLN